MEDVIVGMLMSCSLHFAASRVYEAKVAEHGLA
jgi:hypothetical protein